MVRISQRRVRSGEALSVTARRVALLAVAYVALGRLAFSVSVQHGNVTSVIFAPEGVALAFVVLYGRRVAPGIVLGQTLLSIWSGPSVLGGLSIGCFNALEAVLGAHLFRRWRIDPDLPSPRDVIALVVLIFAVLQPISATAGVSTLWAIGSIPLDAIPDSWSSWWIRGAQRPLPSIDAIPTAWFHWWIGNGMGQLLVAPVLLTWMSRKGRRHRLTRSELAIGMTGVLVLAVGAVLGSSIPPLLLLATAYPLLVWIGVRGGVRAVLLADLLLAPPVIWAGSRGDGFLSGLSDADRIGYVSFFIASASLLSLLVSTVFEERRHLIEELTVLARRDPMVPVSNRRHLLEVGRSDLTRGAELAVLLVDIDHFKQVNDRYGHAVGDEAIRMVGRHCLAVGPDEDHVGRLGGEEFAVLLPGSDDRAATTAERLRAAVEADTAIVVDGEPVRVTVSVGVAGCQPGAQVEDGLGAADDALYEAKVAGRNRVCIAAGSRTTALSLP